MSKDDVVGLLEAGVEPAKVGEAAQLVGITFAMTPQVDTELRDAGANDGLIALLKRIAPGGSTTTRPQPPATPGAPAVLMVEVMPGGAQVYVDDEPMGTTSQAGRLKLSRLQPGGHTVRVSLAGYSDFEQRIELKIGETALVSAALQNSSAGGTATALGPGQPPAGGGGANPLAGGGASSSGEPGSLGVMIATQSPPGVPGAYITAVAPDSSAERAGLRPGHSILSINDQPVNTPQNLLEMITRSHAGDLLQIAYTDGSRTYTTQAQLMPRSSLPQTSQTLPPAAGGSVAGIANPETGPPQYVQPAMPAASFNVNHDHGSGGTDYCTGVLTVTGGRVIFRASNPEHSFDVGVNEIKGAKRNGVYLALLGAFHIRLKSGPNYNFVVINASGQPQPPEELLRTIGMAMGKN